MAPDSQKQQRQGSALAGVPRSFVSATVARPETSETGVWVGMCAITMTFAAFTSALIVRQGASPDWRHFQLPRILYLNTLILLASSVTVGMARWRFSSVAAAVESAPAAAKRFFTSGIYGLYVTAALGALFLGGQILAWRDLAAQGLFLSTNPSSSFFYVFTTLHGVHLAGGICGIIYMIRKIGRTTATARVTGLGAVCVYWHFMDALWVYLFLLLAMRT